MSAFDSTMPNVPLKNRKDKERQKQFFHIKSQWWKTVIKHVAFFSTFSAVANFTMIISILIEYIPFIITQGQ